jgi:hypothetical protein
MAEKNTDSLAALKKFIRGQSGGAKDWDKLLTDRGGILRDLGMAWAYGTILQAGKLPDGTVHVQFVSASAQGWSGPWPKWAFDLAYDALLHNKQVFVIYTGDIPSDENLLQLQIFSYPA